MQEPKAEILEPNFVNYIKSFREIGYSFEVAVADIIDNSISAGADVVKIYAIQNPKPLFCVLDNGSGMSENELKEAMRMGSKDPNMLREPTALGKFGLGLKSASFSQCKKLTVLSKQDDNIYAKQWDLDYMCRRNDWYLLTPDLEDYKQLEIFHDFNQYATATLVIWEEIDKVDQITSHLQTLREHLSLVFHQFLEGTCLPKKLKIFINNTPIKPFNPFNPDHPATFDKGPEIIPYNGKRIEVTPFILPHHSKVSQVEWEKYGGRDGYVKSQGFYLYRAHRLLVYGKWWGLFKASEATKLVRIKIEISNDQDALWRIDVKKSMANPLAGIKEQLKRIASKAMEDGKKPFSVRGRKIGDKNVVRFWDLMRANPPMHFAINKDHPFYKNLIDALDDSQKKLLNLYLKSLQAYLPIEAIQIQVQQNPHAFLQEDTISETERKEMLEWAEKLGLSPEEIAHIEGFKKRK
ncbi:ATPase [Helicobacter sp. NHP19-003]|uniref:ATPase n=1 Tax=Helicobacter gastrocanis TaxID=2849641 RepID=A0ABM7SBU6_9HELI|nr:ATP-binding protein [Helicobacter sp. NHP19-003]BCZ17829.1 ATPase [Helicobacter sp. NHP19-003]